MPEVQRQQWIELFDPSRYILGIRCPILFINGTNDYAYPLDSYQKSYRLVPGPVQLSIRVDMPHSHEDGWSPPEICAFVDSILKGGVPLPKLTEMEPTEGQARARFQSTVNVEASQLHYTSDAGPWQKRKWQSIPARIEEETVTAELPEQRPLVYYLSVTDQR